MIAATDSDISGLFGVLIGLGILLVAGVWLLFPFLMIEKFNKVIGLLREISGKLPAPPKAPSAPVATIEKKEGEAKNDPAVYRLD